MHVAKRLNFPATPGSRRLKQGGRGDPRIRARSWARGAVRPARPELDPGLTGALREAGGGRTVTAISVDLFYDPRPDADERIRDAGADVVEMEAAAVLAIAGRRGARAGCLLLVSDLLAGGGRERIAAAELEAAELRLGQVALAALRAR